MTTNRKTFRNINALTDLPSYRLPAAGWVSILHRISGAVMFILLPFILWIFDRSLTSELSYEGLTASFAQGVGVVPGAALKLVALVLLWAFLHHLFAGMRHLIMDATHRVTKGFGRSSAQATLVLSLALTALLGAKLFGLY